MIDRCRDSLIKIERFDNCLDDFAWMRDDGYGDRPFVRRRFFERLELAVEQRRRHKMIGPRRDASGDQAGLALEIDKPDVAPLADEDIAIGALKRRAGDDAMIVRTPRCVDPVG